MISRLIGFREVLKKYFNEKLIDELAFGSNIPYLDVVVSKSNVNPENEPPSPENSLRIDSKLYTNKQLDLILNTMPPRVGLMNLRLHRKDSLSPLCVYLYTPNEIAPHLKYSIEYALTLLKTYSENIEDTL